MMISSTRTMTYVTGTVMMWCAAMSYHHADAAEQLMLHDRMVGDTYQVDEMNIQVDRPAGWFVSKGDFGSVVKTVPVPLRED